MSGPLKRYKVTTAGGVETVMKLDEADAERYGAEPLEAGTRTVNLPEEPEPAKPQAKKRAASPNKARRPAANKDGGAGGGDD